MAEAMSVVLMFLSLAMAGFAVLKWKLQGHCFLNLPIYAKDRFFGNFFDGAFKEGIISSRFIVTAAPVFHISAWQELKGVCDGVRKLRDFKDGTFLIETPMSECEFTQAVVRVDPIFIRHLMPVQTEIRIRGKRERDLPDILTAVRDFCKLEAGDTFSVQCRRLGTYYDYRTRGIS